LEREVNVHHSEIWNTVIVVCNLFRNNGKIFQMDRQWKQNKTMSMIENGSSPIVDEFPLHKSVFNGDTKLLSQLIRDGEHDIAQKDVHGKRGWHELNHFIDFLFSWLHLITFRSNAVLPKVMYWKLLWTFKVRCWQIESSNLRLLVIYIGGMSSKW